MDAIREDSFSGRRVSSIEEFCSTSIASSLSEMEIEAGKQDIKDEEDRAEHRASRFSSESSDEEDDEM